MDREDIIRLVLEAVEKVSGQPSTPQDRETIQVDPEAFAFIAEFANLVIAAEREACARLAERSESADHCAAAIRARGKA